MQMGNKYKVRVTDNLGSVRIVEFTNVRFNIEDGVIVIREQCTNKLKGTYPTTYSLEISDVTNGDTN